MKTFEMQTLAGLENKTSTDKVLMGSDSNFCKKNNYQCTLNRSYSEMVTCKLHDLQVMKRKKNLPMRTDLNINLAEDMTLQQVENKTTLLQ